MTLNSPSSPFSAPYNITMLVDVSNESDDRRRIKGEAWCLKNTRHKWFRRVLTRNGTVEFHFQDATEATMFWLAN
jgi:hypothetical protein